MRGTGAADGVGVAGPGAAVMAVSGSVALNVASALTGSGTKSAPASSPRHSNNCCRQA